MKPSGELFLEQTWSRVLGVDVKKEARRPQGRRHAPTLVGPSQLHRPTSSSYIYPYTPKTSRSTIDRECHRRKTLCHQKPIGTLFRHPARGGSLIGGHPHHPGTLHDEEGVVHPRGWGYVPVAMCLIPLSHVLDLARSWCIVSFVIIVGSYDVSPPLLSCDELSFPLEVIFSDWVFIWEHLMYVLPCLCVVTMGYHVPLDVCFGDQLAGSAHEPMHRGWHTFLNLQ